MHDLGRAVNRRLAADEPWRLDDGAAAHCLADLVRLLDALAVAAWPIVPETAERIRAALGRSPVPARWSLPDRPPAVTGPPSPPYAAP